VTNLRSSSNFKRMFLAKVNSLVSTTKTSRRPC
jgi:hypothetical protein